MSGDPKTVGALLAWARQLLDNTGTTNVAQEALWLLASALEMEHHALVSRAEQPVTTDQLARAKTFVSRRIAREPLQYILGTQEFCGLDFAVTSSVLIPRPETELLVHAVLKEGGLAEGATLVDVGTGSGCMAVTFATILEGIRIVAVDCSVEALAVAKSNAVRHGVGEKIVWSEGNLLSPLRDRITLGTVDVIVSNPPYITEEEWEKLQPEVRNFEPRLALIAGPRGTEFHERLFHDAKEFLAPDGLLVMEIGLGQLPLVQHAAEQAGGYTRLQTIKDEAGIDRVIIARRAG
ncbi:MAG: peptide chain release factor N(5)-glutamine methyltransferase [Nitrospira sp.]|nr:peptide chain release factor N(5)-glutamine methyltransferase [Nitrospira sp.]MDH4370108.1 peptide chain release factor N(5)-glutamine methyltransferase [Nitrospira sp.]MDH5496493.1 peptide chain release factor N(5)-glutamine methyltransferase [Nitrospira sp.]